MQGIASRLQVDVRRKGKRPQVPEDESFDMFFSTADGYPNIPLPPIYVVWMWLFGSPHSDRNQVLFQHAECKVRWSDFLTLKEGTNVSKVIVDAWCSVLNAREQPRRGGMLSRLFISTAATIETVVGISASRDARLSWFKRRLDAEFQTTDLLGTATLDMYVFPILRRLCFYVMCISFKHPKFVIIDSSASTDMHTQQYEGAPDELRNLLAAYLDSKQHTVRALRLRVMQPERMRLAWSDTAANGDSGVYAMRHMEAFVGQEAASWGCGLRTGGHLVIGSLRRRYLHNILLSTVNANMQGVRTRAAEYDRNRMERLLNGAPRTPQ